jgi:LacI family transcriptional regulator
VWFGSPGYLPAMLKSNRTTVYDIARELNLTASTISRALNDHPSISERTKRSVLRMSKKLDYQPHRIAAALRNGKSNIIGVIVPVADRNFFASIVRGIEEKANESNYQVIICQTYEDPVKEEAAIDALLNTRVDGIIASLSKRTERFNHFSKVKSKGIPLILFDRTNDDLKVSHVVIDDYAASYEATRHLISQGCRRIAHFTNVGKIGIYKERLRGYKTALLDAGIAFDESLVLASNLQLDDGRKCMQSLLSRNVIPDAVFSASDLGAVGAMQVLKERHIRIPEQVALIGFSNEPFTMFCDPPLTTADQRCKQMGHTASEMFLQQVKAGDTKFVPKKVVLMPELIIRASSLKKNNLLESSGKS